MAQSHASGVAEEIRKTKPVHGIIQIGYLHSPNTPPWRGAQLKHRDSFTFTSQMRVTRVVAMPVGSAALKYIKMKISDMNNMHILALKTTTATLTLVARLIVTDE
jgi:hypothetical protein